MLMGEGADIVMRYINKSRPTPSYILFFRLLRDAMRCFFSCSLAVGHWAMLPMPERLTSAGLPSADHAWYIVCSISMDDAMDRYYYLTDQ